MELFLIILGLILLPGTISAAFKIGELAFKSITYVLGAILFAGFVMFTVAALVN